MQRESEHDAEGTAEEQPTSSEHPLEGGQTDAVDEAQESPVDDVDTSAA